MSFKFIAAGCEFMIACSGLVTASIGIVLSSFGFMIFYSGIKI